MAARIRRLRIKHPHYIDVLLILLLLGVVLGTIFANLTYERFDQQVSQYMSVMGKSVRLSSIERKRFFFLVLRQRSFEAIFLWIMGLTVFSIPCYYVLVTGWGFAVGVILSILTHQKGVFGLVYYLLTILPHYVLYLIVWGILAFWAGKKNQKLHFFSFLLLLGIMILGVCLEAFINPVLLTWYQSLL